MHAGASNLTFRIWFLNCSWCSDCVFLSTALPAVMQLKFTYCNITSTKQSRTFPLSLSCTSQCRFVLLFFFYMIVQNNYYFVILFLAGHIDWRVKPNFCTHQKVLLGLKSQMDVYYALARHLLSLEKISNCGRYFKSLFVVLSILPEYDFIHCK